MNKEEILDTLNELNRQIDFDEIDNNIKVSKINDLEKEIQNVLEKISEFESNLNDNEYYENYANSYRKKYETMYDNAKLLLIKKNDDIARINESIEILNQEHNDITNTIDQCNKEIEMLENKDNLTSLEKSKLVINKKRVINLKNALENNKRMIQNNNDLLNNNTNSIDMLNKNVEVQNQYLKNFDDNMRNEIIENKKEHDKKGLEVSRKLAAGLNQYKSSLEINFKNKLNNIIIDLKNDKITPEEASHEINYYKDRLFKEYIQKDEELRKNEINKNKSDQKECQDLINNLQTKLSNQQNYKLKDSTRSNMMNSAKKIERLAKQGKVLFYEGYRKDYEEITKMYEEDKKNLLDELNQDISDERKKEINNKIKDLNITISQGKELTYDYSKYKNLFDKVEERAKSQEIDRSAIRLDESKLNEYVSLMNSLKNRQKFLESNVSQLLNKFDNKTKELKTNNNSPKQMEIVSIYRPLKEKIKQKMKKVAVAIVTSMTLMLSANAALNINNNVDENINDTVIENTIDEKTTPNMTEEEAIKKVEEELNKEIVNNISMNDQVTIKDGSSIYRNQYDAENKTNAYNPLNDLKEKKDVIGISIKMPDGSFKFVQDDNDIQKLLDNGGVISACLTGEGNKPEGFWNVNDISNVNKIEQQIGGMTR